MTNVTNPEITPKPSRRGNTAALLVAALAVGAGAGGTAVHLAAGGHGGDEATAEKKQMFECPMHPTIVQDHPGDCPICGMKLVPVQQSSEDAHAGHGGSGGTPEGLATVSIDPGRQQLIGLKTAAAERGTVGGTWRTVGRVAMDETRVKHINVKVASFVEKIHVDFVGRPVKKGEPLFSIYSPELYSAQEEYLLAFKTRRDLAGSATLAGSGDSLVGAARKKLRLWDIPQREIEAIEKTGEASKTLTLYSPISGVVTKKDVVEGMRLEAGAMPYEIVDLSQVWVLADVYESELRHVKTGMSATLTLKAYPNRTFKGRVVFLDPLLDPKTRTAKVRLTFANPTGELRPEMFGEVVLQGSAREGLRVPADAVIDSGTMNVVFVSVGDGRFQPREVKLGDADGTHVEVVSGLSDGEQVVTRANFLVDSESRLKASLAALSAEGGAKKGEGGAAAADPHAGHGR